MSMKRTRLKRGTSQLKRTAFKRSNKRLKQTPKKKSTKVGVWREYGLEMPYKPRYAGLKGIYWYLLSIKVRKRDFKEYSGECIDMCGKYATDWHDFDGGHFISAGEGGFDLLFDERNVNGQLKGCNNPTFSPNSQIGYAKGLDIRYGKGTADKLWERYQNKNKIGGTTKEWSQNIYDLKIKELLLDI